MQNRGGPFTSMLLHQHTPPLTEASLSLTYPVSHQAHQGGARLPRPVVPFLRVLFRIAPRHPSLYLGPRLTHPDNPGTDHVRC